MALPINIDELINGKSVEWERIEFKEGWNPETTLKTICAFANDFNNWGGGYIIIGVKEENGIPVLPPIGLNIKSIDKIQQELNNFCRRILPNYFPIVEPVDFQGKKILILWCPGGNARPYKAPSSLGKDTQYYYFIRRFSSTVIPTRDEEKELFSMNNQIPFDDCTNSKSNISDFDLTSIRSFLNNIQSELESEIPNLSIKDIAKRMNIAEGPDEYIFPKNVGLLFFAKDVKKYFPNAKIEFVTFKDEAGTEYTENIFDGQIHIQLVNALSYFKNIIHKEKVIKRNNKPEADRFFNYPYDAFEEALCNAVYHRGYDNDTTIEVRVFPSRIDIISFPGPLLPLNKENLKNLHLNVRKYRNRRIGELLKELHLTEGRGTGIPSILKSLKKNGSPFPVFETDDERSYFKTTITIHHSFLSFENLFEQVSVQTGEQANLLIIHNIDEIIAFYEQNSEQAGEQVNLQIDSAVKPEKKQNLIRILSFCKTEKSKTDILASLNLSNSYKNYKYYVFSLIKLGLLELSIKDRPSSPNQKYITTKKGLILLEILQG